MSNFTVAIQNDLLSQVKVIASKKNTSVNAIIRVLLEGFVVNDGLTFSGNYGILVSYSLGQISTKEVVKMLHLQDESELHALLSSAELPAPRLSLDQENEMQGEFALLVSENDKFMRTADPYGQTYMMTIRAFLKAMQSKRFC